jgi:hypothetical protein
MVDVFISYSRSDLAAVTRLAEAVEAEGYDVWWDADLPPHLSYGDVITAKMGMAKAAIVVWSKASAASEWVRAEADMARNQKKLVQTALGDVMPPLPFNQIQFPEIGEWHGEPDHPGWRKVKASLAELVGRPAGPAAPLPPRDRVREPAAPPTPVKPSRWLPYAGLASGVLALLVGAVMVIRGNSDERTEARAEQAAAAQPTPIETTAKPVPSVAHEDAEFAAPPAVQQAAPTAADAEGPSNAAPRVSASVAPSSADFAQGAIIPDSSTRRLTPADIAGLGPLRLRLARNEIFARHGRRFNDPDLADYFGRQSWYRPVADEVDLSEVELANVALLRRTETSHMAGAMR